MNIKKYEKLFYESPVDWVKLNESIKNKMELYEEFFKDFQMFHSDFQIENFVLGEEQGVTVWGQYKQALRELHKRYRGIRDALYNIAKEQIEIEKLKRKRERLLSTKPEDYDLEVKLIDVEIERKEFNLIMMLKMMKDTEREADIFYSILLKLKPIIETKTPEEWEREYWLERLKKDIQNNILFGNISLGLARAIRGIKDKEIKEKLIKEYFKAQAEMIINRLLVEQSVSDKLRQEKIEDYIIPDKEEKPVIEVKSSHNTSYANKSE